MESERRAMTGGVRIRLADVGQHTQGCNGTIIKKGVTPGVIIRLDRMIRGVY
jgi:hypothetical protein